MDFESNRPAPRHSSNDEDTLFAAGFAGAEKASASPRANLFFSCASDSAKGKMKYVKASMFSQGDQLTDDATQKDRMIILTSVSRALAEEVGCTSEAHLPATVPNGESTVSSPAPHERGRVPAYPISGMVTRPQCSVSGA